MLNDVRRDHPATHWLRNVRFHWTESDHVLAWSKKTGDDIVLVVVNLDSHGVRETTVHVDLPALGFEWHDSIAVHDVVTGADYTWGEANYVRLDPFVEPAHVFTVRRSG
jgi:starch synthase (maltosyl-transferring)